MPIKSSKRKAGAISGAQFDELADQMIEQYKKELIRKEEVEASDLTADSNEKKRSDFSESEESEADEHKESISEMIEKLKAKNKSIQADKVTEREEEEREIDELDIGLLSKVDEIFKMQKAEKLKEEGRAKRMDNFTLPKAEKKRFAF